MIPGVPLPAGSKVRTPIDVTLKAGWRFDVSRRVFLSKSGDRFTPRGRLPKGSRIVHKVPRLAAADEARLTKPERELRRYMQVILRPGESSAKYVDVVRAWPPVAEARLAPQVSLP
jgi:hypothetical protein